LTKSGIPDIINTSMKVQDIISEDEEQLDPEMQEPQAEEPTAVPDPQQQVQPTPEPQAVPTPVAQPVYADNKQNNAAIAALQIGLPHGNFKQQAASGAKKVRSIRARSVNLAELRTAMTNWGATPATTDGNQATASSSFPAHSFKKGDVLYTIVIGMKGQKEGDDTSTGIGRKELTPAGLGINGGIFNKQELIDKVKHAVNQKFGKRDPLLASTLIALVDNADTGGQTPLLPEQASHIASYLGTVSQDFGEILAPILIMKPEDKAELPTGNNPLVDVKLPGMNMSVKALTGSGTSFRAIHDLMDKYEKSISNDKNKQAKFKILKQFHPSNAGNNKDKIIAAAATAKIPEYKKLVEIAGVRSISNFQFMTVAVARILDETTEDYTTFLAAVYPAMIAGDWGKPVGLPADGAYYLGMRENVKQAKAAGKPSFDADPVNGGADILTYVLGVGLLNYITKGKHSDEYKEMMTSIVKEADAVIGHITINADGTLKLKTRPFSDMKFEFQYHAPSHIPGNNLPGFIGILD